MARRCAAADRRWSLDSLAAQTEGAAELALRCIDAIDDRGWEGDAELLDQLGGALGRGPAPLLRPLPVDLEQLADVLEGDPAYGGRVDLQTGQVWPQFVIDDADGLARWPNLPDRWAGFSGDRRRGRARTWLADAGYAARGISGPRT